MQVTHLAQGIFVGKQFCAPVGSQLRSASKIEQRYRGRPYAKVGSARSSQEQTRAVIEWLKTNNLQFGTRDIARAEIGIKVRGIPGNGKPGMRNRSEERRVGKGDKYW